MGLFSEFKQGFNEGREKVRRKIETRGNEELSEVVKLVEPNTGRIVTMQIIDDAHIFCVVLEAIVTLANAIKAEVNVSGKIVTLKCPDSDTAEAVRKTWQ